MLKTATRIASCLGVAVAAGTFVPAQTVETSVAIFAAGVVTSFGHELCKRFHERASAFAESVWGLDQNHHLRQGVRRAQIAATKEVLRLWRQKLPRHAVADDDQSDALASLVASWCAAQGKESVVEAWSHTQGDAAELASLRKAFEAAFGAEVDESSGMAARARQAGDLATREAFDDSIEGALALAQSDWAQLIRNSEALVSFRNDFFQTPISGHGWLNAFLRAIGNEFKKPDGEFKRLWDSMQIGGISAMLLDDIELSGTRHRELTELIEARSTRLEQELDAVKGDTEAILRGQGDAAEIAERHHSEQMAAVAALRSEMARDRGVDAKVLIPMFTHLGKRNLSIDEIREGAEEAIVALLAQARRAPEPTNSGADISATIGAAREKLSKLDTAGALAGLTAKIAEEDETRRQRLIPLLHEKLSIERLSYDHESAKATLRRLTALDMDEVWYWNELGDLFVTTGDLAGALTSYRAGLEIIDRLAQSDSGNAGWQRDLSVSLNRIGNVQVAQGDLAGALTSYRAGLKIADRLAQSDSGNAGWQRDLSVSLNKIGDVRVAQGDLAGALTSYRAGMKIADRLAQSDPGNAGWQRDLSVSHAKLADVHHKTGDMKMALAALSSGKVIMIRLTALSPENVIWKNDLTRFESALVRLRG